ncbi:MAG: InlB B-repeat-containing protein [Treponema sp.]|nr:InlB B-repeat-containing protein [Treponema sp.]
MKNTRTVQRAVSVFAVIAFIGFALSSCGGNGSPAAPVYHTVTFDVGGDITVVPAEQVRNGLTVSEPAEPTPPSGQYFDGWCTTDAFTPPRFDFDTPITAPRTLYGRWVAVMYTVTFDTGVGGSDVMPQQVAEGHTVTLPAEPTRAFTAGAGLWSDAVPSLYIFGGWQYDGEAWDFATDTVSGEMTLTVVWTAPAPIAAYDMDAVVAYVNTNPGTLFLLIDEDVETDPHTLTVGEGALRLSIIGLDETREIRLSANGAMFTVNQGVTLTLGENVTLVGRSEGGNGDENNDSALVLITGGTMYMNEGSSVTGNHNTANFGGGVNVDAGGRLVLDGGTISDNTTAGTGGGVNNAATDSIFEMRGGTISGNTSSALGGGVQSNGYLHMSSGTIYGNDAEDGLLNNVASVGYALAITGPANTAARAQFGTFDAVNFPRLSGHKVKLMITEGE